MFIREPPKVYITRTAGENCRRKALANGWDATVRSVTDDVSELGRTVAIDPKIVQAGRSAAIEFQSAHVEIPESHTNERRSNTMSGIVEVGEHQNGQQIEIQRGQTLRVTLPEVRTAGVRWSLRTSSQQILTPLADEIHQLVQ
jgi:hypothetical protein